MKRNRRLGMSNVVGEEELWSSKILESFMNEGWQNRQRKIVSQREFVNGKIQSLIGRFCLRIKLYPSHLQRASCQASVTYENRPTMTFISLQILRFIIYFRRSIEIPFIILHWRNGWGLREGKAGRLDGKFLYRRRSQHGTLGHLFFALALRFFLSNELEGWHPSHEGDAMGKEINKLYIY